MKNFITLILVFLINLTLKATTYYVSITTGLNTNNGKSPTLAFQTIDRAILTYSSGDTIIVISGNYQIVSSINISKPLILLGKSAILDAGSWNSNVAEKKIIYIENTNNVTIDGFTLQNLVGSFARGIFVLGSGSDIVISNCHLKNISWNHQHKLDTPPLGNANAIMVRGSKTMPIKRLTIKNNTIHNCSVGTSETVALGGNLDSFIVDSNVIYDCANIGIGVNGHWIYGVNDPPSSLNYARNGYISRNKISRCIQMNYYMGAIYLDGASNCTVEGNELFNNAFGISLGQERPTGSGAKKTSNNRIINNLICYNSLGGVMLGNSALQSDPEPIRVVDNVFSNNTLFKNRTLETINNIPPPNLDKNQGEIALNNSDNLIIENNIIYPIADRVCIVQFWRYTSTRLHIKYNNFYRENKGSFIDIGGDGGSLNSIYGYKNFMSINNVGIDSFSSLNSPLFLDTSKFDFRIDSTSLCIDRGNPQTTLLDSGFKDFYNNPRLFNGRIDIGAHESQVVAKRLNVIPDTIKFSSSVGSFDSLKISSNVNWSIESDQTWCTISTSSGSNDSIVKVMVQANSGQKRYAVLSVSGFRVVPKKTIVIQSENDNAKLISSLNNLLRIFPNPVKQGGKIRIENKSEYTLKDLSIFNIYGQKIIDYKETLIIFGRSIEFNMTVPIGIYFLKGTFDDTVFQLKIVVVE